MCCIGYSPLYIFLLFSCDPGLRSTIRFRLRVIQVSTVPSLPSFSVLNGQIDCSLFMSFVSFPFFFVHFCFCFLWFRLSLYVLGCFTYLANTLAYKNAFMYRNMRMHKWAFVGTYMFRKIRGKEYDFFSLGTQYLLQCCAFSFIHFFFWALCCAFFYYYFFWGVRCYVHFLFIYLFFLWGRYFERHRLNLGFT